MACSAPQPMPIEPIGRDPGVVHLLRPTDMPHPSSPSRAASPIRGSQKHWTSEPTFAVDLLRLLRPVDARLTADSLWMPRGYAEPREARLETFGPQALPGIPAWSELQRWWLAHTEGANTPNWDIAMRCEIEHKPGLVLVEAKANVPELSEARKPQRVGASAKSEANHRQIAAALTDACEGLRTFNAGVTLSADSHYQLSNRLAFAWKLATLGIPTVLMYLGFTGDTGIRDAGEPFANEEHWEEVFDRYRDGIVPGDLLERRLECGTASVWFLVRSRPVGSASPPRGARARARTELPENAVGS